MRNNWELSVPDTIDLFCHIVIATAQSDISGIYHLLVSFSFFDQNISYQIQIKMAMSLNNNSSEDYKNQPSYHTKCNRNNFNTQIIQYLNVILL